MKKVITSETANILEKNKENEIDILISDYMLVAKKAKLTKAQVLETARLEVASALIEIEKSKEKYTKEQIEENLLTYDVLLHSLKFMNDKYEVEILLN